MLKTINSGDPEFNQRDTTPVLSSGTVHMFTRLYFNESHPSATESFSWVLLDVGQGPKFTELLCRHDFIPEMGTALHFTIATPNWNVGNRGKLAHTIQPLQQEVLQAQWCVEKHHQSCTLDICLQCKLGRNLPCPFNILIPYLSSDVY